MANNAPWEMDWGVPLAQTATEAKLGDIAGPQGAVPAAAPPGGAISGNPWEINWNQPGGGAGVSNAMSPGEWEDFAKSGLAGVRNGAIKMATMPSDMRDLSLRAVQKIIDLVHPGTSINLPAATEEFLDRDLGHGVTPRTVLGVVPFSGAGPTFPQESAELEKRGIPDYEPKTTPGGYSKAVGEMVPMALTGGESIAANLLKNAAAPGIGSQFLGNRFEGSALETPARFIGGLIGGFGAHGADIAQSALRTRAAQNDAAQAVSDLTGVVANRGAVARLAKDVRNDALTPEGAAQRMAQLGDEGMLLDAGRQLQGRAEAIATQPGAGQNAVLDAVEGRTGEFGGNTATRIQNTLDTTMGHSPDVVQLTNDVSNLVDQHARPLYESVMADHPVVNVPAEITSRPAVAAAMKNATQLAKQYGEQLESPAETHTILQGPGFHIADDVVNPAQTSLRYWDYVKKDLDRRVNSYMKSGGVSELNSADKADLGGLIDARNALRNHLDEATGGAYAQARAVAAQKPELLDALDMGRKSLQNGLLREEMADQYSNLSIPQQSMFRAGMRREIDRIIDTARNDGAAARRLLDTNQNREKIESVFGADAARALDNRIAAETHFQNTTNKVSANSRTAVRQELRKDTESPSVTTPPQASALGYVHKAATGLLQGMRDTGMENTRAALGSILTTPGRNVPELVRILSGYNARAAQSARPSAMRDAGALARVLVPTLIARQPSQQGQ